MKNFVKNLLTSSVLLFSLNSFASDKTTLNCTYLEGGWDDEKITANLTNGEISSIQYISLQGEVGPFKKILNNLFQHTTKDMIIIETVSFAPDHKSATLVVTYKDNGDTKSTQNFTCE